MLNEYSCYQQYNGNANKPELLLQTMLMMVVFMSFVLVMMLMRACLAMMIVFM